jgi:hypothetical protein
MDVAAATFPRPKNITVAGSSAGGVGAAAFAPFLARFEYGNNTQLTVFNDAGPIAVNLAEQADVAARAADWQFDQFYPASCTACDAFGQQTAIIEWRLDNDSTIREAFYETEFDLTNRFFTKPTRTATSGSSSTTLTPPIRRSSRRSSTAKNPVVWCLANGPRNSSGTATATRRATIFG